VAYQKSELRPAKLEFTPLKQGRQEVTQLYADGIRLINGDAIKAKGDMLPIALNIKKSGTKYVKQTSYDFAVLTLKGTVFAAFAIAHELGHKRKIYGDYDDDGGPLSILESGANNEKIRAACFDELEPHAPPSNE
jgi:hypothetical protein